MLLERPYATIDLLPPTQELNFRQFTFSDIPDILTAASDPQMFSQLALSRKLQTEEDAYAWVEEGLYHYSSGQGFRLAITNGDELVGCIEMKLFASQVAIVGYWITAAQRRKGYASQTLRHITSWLFEQDLAWMVELLTLPGNKASQGVAKSCGFAYQESFTQYDVRFDRDVTFNLYCRSLPVER
jgi:RimJ/RimL family protein N-acetyltransferase